MYATNFEYDNKYLDSYGFIVCDFDSQSGSDIIDVGSQITFNTVPRGKGDYSSLAGTQYDECIQATFDICKNPDIYDDLRIYDNEYKELMRWLNRKEFLKFQFIDDDNYSHTCYYEASFNIQKIKIREILYGIRLTMYTNRPFGYGNDEYILWHITDTEKGYMLIDISDEIGFIYPDVKITCEKDGDICIYNKNTDCKMCIKNCSAGEVITIDGNAQIISTSLNNHKIYNDFNFEFLKISNTINNRTNYITVSSPCKLEIRYKPIVKDCL